MQVDNRIWLGPICSNQVYIMHDEIALACMLEILDTVVTSPYRVVCSDLWLEHWQIEQIHAIQQLDFLRFSDWLPIRAIRTAAKAPQLEDSKLKTAPTLEAEGLAPDVDIDKKGPKNPPSNREDDK